MRTLAFILAYAPVLAAQVEIGMSPLAYALDESSHTIRPLIGTPGSAYLGRPIVLPFAVQFAELRGASGVIISDAGVAYRVAKLGTAPEIAELGSATHAWVDSTGASALLAESPQLVRFPGSAVVPMPGPVAAVAFAGRCAILATSGENSTALHRLCADRPSELQMVRTFPGLTISAIAAAGDSLFLASRASRQVLHVREPFEASSIASFDIDASIIALAAVNSTDAIVALENDPRLLALPSREWLDLPTPADRLQWLASGRLLACSAVNFDQPLLVLDLAQDRGSFFIPLARSDE